MRADFGFGFGLLLLSFVCYSCSHPFNFHNSKFNHLNRFPNHGLLNNGSELLLPYNFTFSGSYIFIADTFGGEQNLCNIEDRSEVNIQDISRFALTSPGFYVVDMSIEMTTNKFCSKPKERIKTYLAGTFYREQITSDPTQGYALQVSPAACQDYDRFLLTEFLGYSVFFSRSLSFLINSKVINESYLSLLLGEQTYPCSTDCEKRYLYGGVLQCVTGSCLKWEPGNPMPNNTPTVKRF